MSPPPKPRTVKRVVTAQQAFALGLEHQKHGRMAEAESVYRQIVAAAPGHVEAIHHLGLVCFQSGRLDEAIGLIDRSLEMQPRRAEFHSNRGSVLRRLGRLAEAAEAYQRAVALNPDFADGLNNLGVALKELGRLDEAATAYRRALALKPEFAELHSNLAGVLQRQGKLDEALAAAERAVALKPDYAEAHASRAGALFRLGRMDEAGHAFRRAIEINPAFAEAHSNLGGVLQFQGKIDESIAAYRRAIELRPNYPEAYSNLGGALRQKGELAEGVAACRRAIALRPGYAEAHSNLGGTLRQQGLHDEAIVECRRAIELNANLAEAHNNLAVALKELGRFAEAEPAYRRAIALMPDYHDAHANLGMTLLGQGKLAEGWAEYEWRWGVKSIAVTQRNFAPPQWQGTPVEQGKLLLWGEQGVGDAILYAGMIPEALGRVRHCVLECDPRLRPLFARSFPSVEVVAIRNPPDPRLAAADIAYQSPLGSLPRWFRNRFEDFPPRRAYLAADAEKTARLRARYRALGPGPVIGVSWRSKNPVVGEAKTTTLSAWAPILRRPGFTFVNLQYGDCAAELEQVRESLGVKVHHDATIDSLKDLDGFAAQVAAMDLVISVSNTTAHFAGALGVPAWVLLADGMGLLWYWFLQREDSPWYPSLRLFRQQIAGDWTPAIDRIAKRLAEFARDSKPDARGR